MRSTYNRFAKVKLTYRSVSPSRFPCWGIAFLLSRVADAVTCKSLLPMSLLTWVQGWQTKEKYKECRIKPLWNSSSRITQILLRSKPWRNKTRMWELRPSCPFQKWWKRYQMKKHLKRKSHRWMTYFRNSIVTEYSTLRQAGAWWIWTISQRNLNMIWSHQGPLQFSPLTTLHLFHM